MDKSDDRQERLKTNREIAVALEAQTRCLQHCSLRNGRSNRSGVKSPQAISTTSESRGIAGMHILEHSPGRSLEIIRGCPISEVAWVRGPLCGKDFAPA